MNQLGNSNTQYKKIISLTFLVAYLCLLIHPHTAQADTVTGDNYSIDVNTIDTNPQPSVKIYTKGKNNKKINPFTTGPNYTVTAPASSLSITLSQDSIDYGIFSPTNPVIRTSGISLKNTFLGSEIFGYESTPLLSTSKQVIENTSCDNGACTPETSALWNNTLTYGFGYRCDSQDATICDLQFSNADYFKPYADSSTGHVPQTIIYAPQGNSQATISYKVNISGTQKTGSYNNSIIYLAIPNF
jgi:hypothetical protein